MQIIHAQRYSNPLDSINTVSNAQNVLETQQFLSSVRIDDAVLGYLIDLCEATRHLPLVELGVSPRGVSALVRMARARAVLSERDFVVPDDIQSVFPDVCTHRMTLRPQARVEGVTAHDLLRQVLQQIKPPAVY